MGKKTLVFRAMNLAKKAHAAQVRKYSGEPYEVHLAEVARYVEDAGCRPEVVAAAWLHDIIEDQNVTRDQLQSLFGRDVADLVWMVTDQSKLSDGNRAVRKEIDRLHVARANPEGKTIKLADLISNTKDIAVRDPNFAVTYLREKRLLLPDLIEGDPILYKTAWQLLEKYDTRNG